MLKLNRSQYLRKVISDSNWNINKMDIFTGLNFPCERRGGTIKTYQRSQSPNNW